MVGFYKITKAIKDYLVANPNVNTVKLGRFDEIDLNKQTIYPLAQIVMGDVAFDNGTMSFNMEVVVVDSVYQPDTDELDSFEGRDNKQDVYNTTLSVVNGLQDSLNRGALYQNYFQLNGEPSATPIEEKFSNLLAGWSLSVDVSMPTDVNDCDLIIELPDFPDYQISAFMQTAIYDTNSNGIVDNSEKLAGNLPDYFAKSIDLTATDDKVNEHIEDTTIHFTEGSISITESQISDFKDYALNDDLSGYTSDFNSHTGDTTIHYTQAEISITESQISDFKDYSLTGHTHVSTDITDFDSAVANAEIDTLDSVTTRGSGTTNNISVGSVKADYIDLDITAGEPTYKEGRLFYDNTNKTVGLFDSESDSTLQIGQEQRVRVYNNSGITIINGQAVAVVGTTVDSIVEVGLAIASGSTALNTIGIATHDIEDSTYGWATTAGVVNDVNTSAYTEGAALYLSDTVAGAYTITRPQSPSYEVRMGGIIKQDATAGKIFAELRIIGNQHDISKFFNGSILEDHSVTITTTPTTTTLTLDDGGDFLSLLLDQEFVIIPVPTSIVLTNGTDTNPVDNFVYADLNGTLTVSTVGFPTAQQYVPIAEVLLQSALSADTYGPYSVHQWTDHLSNELGQGHLSHLNEWIRNRPASWQSGVVLTIIEGVSQPTIDLAYTSGVVYQLHRHTFPVTDTATGSKIYEINNPTTPYIQRDGISPAIDTDSLGN